MAPFVENKDTAQPFQKLYDDEIVRLRDLVERGKVMIGIVTAYFAFFTFSIEKLDLAGYAASLLLLLVVFAVVVFVSALAFALYALKVTNYSGCPDPEQELRDIEQQRRSAEEFWQTRMAIYAVAANRNAALNNERGNCLRWAGRLLLAGITLHGLTVIIALTQRILK